MAPTQTTNHSTLIMNQALAKTPHLPHMGEAGRDED